MKVYVSVRREAAFHLDRGCYQLCKAVEVIELDASQTGSRPACASCLPQMPRIKVLHRLCHRCGHIRPNPCPHNGGVAVLVPAGSTTRRRMVWPEEAWRYRLAPEPILTLV